MNEQDIFYLKNIKKYKTVTTLCSIFLYSVVLGIIIYKSLTVNDISEYIKLLIISVIIAVILRPITRIILSCLNNRLLNYAKGDKWYANRWFLQWFINAKL